MAAVIVIGAGVGGLSAAVRLLQRGFAVTLVEKEPRPGGYAIAYRRKAYVFDLALHVVPAGGPDQEFFTMAERLGLRLKFVRLSQGFNVHLGDYHFQMANDYEELFVQLAREFPEEASALQAFRRDLEKYVKCYAPVFDYRVGTLRSLPFFLPKIPAFLHHSRLTTDRYLGRFFCDSRLIALLFQPAAFMGIPMADFATVNFMMMFYLLMKYGMYTIEGGGQALTDQLHRAFIAGGGRLLTGRIAEKIYLNNGKAVALGLAGGEILDCQAIVAGNNLADVVNGLIGRDCFSKKYLENLQSLTPSVSVMVLNLGLDCPPQQLGITSHISMVFPDTDLDQCFRDQGNGEDPRGFSITAHSLSDPDFAGEGRHGISIIAGTSPYWLNLDRDEYLREKERVSEQMLVLAERYHPRLRDHIVVRDFCTPKTMNRYTANPQGAIMGFSCTAGIHRRLMAAAKLPVANVVMGSAWTGRLGGFMQSMKSGILAAESI